jgi:hypothetical protein
LTDDTGNSFVPRQRSADVFTSQRASELLQLAVQSRIPVANVRFPEVGGNSLSEALTEAWQLVDVDQGEACANPTSDAERESRGFARCVREIDGGENVG